MKQKAIKIAKWTLGIFVGGFLFISLLVFIYYKSNYKKELFEKKANKRLIEKEIVETSEEKIESSNVIEDVSYSAKDAKGNEYFLKAGKGVIDQNNSNYIFFNIFILFYKMGNQKRV